MAYRVRLRLPYAHPDGVCLGLQRYIMTQEGISIVDFFFSVSRLRIHSFFYRFVYAFATPFQRVVKQALCSFLALLK